LVLLVAPEQGGDAPMFPHLMDQLRINRAGPGRPRTRPDRVRGDKSSRSQPTKSAIGKRRGTVGGGPPLFDKEDYKGRNVVERNFNTFKQWRGLATRYDKLALTYRSGAVLRAVSIWLATLGAVEPLRGVVV
jgi:transposase